MGLVRPARRRWRSIRLAWPTSSSISTTVMASRSMVSHLRSGSGRAARGGGQADVEGAAAPDLGLDADLAVVPLDDAGDDRQAHPLARRRLGVQPLEGDEQLVPRRLRDAQAVVAHVDRHLPRLAGRLADLDLAGPLRVE